MGVAGSAFVSLSTSSAALSGRAVKNDEFRGALAGDRVGHRLAGATGADLQYTFARQRMAAVPQAGYEAVAIKIAAYPPALAMVEAHGVDGTDQAGCVGKLVAGGCHRFLVRNSDDEATQVL
jgi:hypothetical protein